MATSTIKNILSLADSGRTLHLGRFTIMITQEKSISHATTTDFAFPSSFKSTCVVCIPICTQLGFGAYSTISVNNWGLSKCQVYQANNVSAAMRIVVVAIGY